MEACTSFPQFNRPLLARCSVHQPHLSNMCVAGQVANQSSEFADERPISACRFSPDGSLLASAAWSGQLKLWNLPTCQPLATIRAHQDRITGESCADLPKQIHPSAPHSQPWPACIAGKPGHGVPWCAQTPAPTVLTTSVSRVSPALLSPGMPTCQHRTSSQGHQHLNPGATQAKMLQGILNFVIIIIH